LLVLGLFCGDCSSRAIIARPGASPSLLVLALIARPGPIIARPRPFSVIARPGPCRRHCSSQACFCDPRSGGEAGGASGLARRRRQRIETLGFPGPTPAAARPELAGRVCRGPGVSHPSPAFSPGRAVSRSPRSIPPRIPGFAGHAPRGGQPLALPHRRGCGVALRGGRIGGVRRWRGRFRSIAAGGTPGLQPAGDRLAVPAAIVAGSLDRSV
jgi:hypothetical protein